MDLRPGLLPPSVSAERLSALRGETERIEVLLNADDREAADVAISAINAATGHAYGPSDFLHCAGRRDVDDFALEAARPAQPRVPGITRDELVEIVRRIVDAGPDDEYYVRVLEANVAHPGPWTGSSIRPLDWRTSLPSGSSTRG